MRKESNQTSGTSPTESVSIQPYGLRAPAAAIWAGVTPFTIETAWRSGKLKYRVIGGGRVSTVEQLTEWFNAHPVEGGKREFRGRFNTEAA